MNDSPIRVASPDDLRRFFECIEVHPDGHWIWNGAGWSSNKAYGMFSRKGKARSAHRVSYEWFVGKIPVGFHIDHCCHVRRCVNPLHLEAVTAAENCRRAIRPRRPEPAHKPFSRRCCSRGHPWIPENLISVTTGKGRQVKTCKLCRRITRRRAQHFRAALRKSLPPTGARHA